jgi:hypothetical protein
MSFTAELPSLPGSSNVRVKEIPAASEEIGVRQRSRSEAASERERMRPGLLVMKGSSGKGDSDKPCYAPRQKYVAWNMT